MTFITLLRENPCAVLISVSSFSFQICGAIFLLLWSLRKRDSKIKAECLHSSENIWGDFDESGTYTDIPKETIQATAKSIYKNIAAFLDILIGYTCAIFSEGIPLPKWNIFLLVIVQTVIILLIENTLIGVIAKKRYPYNERIYEQKD